MKNGKCGIRLERGMGVCNMCTCKGITIISCVGTAADDLSPIADNIHIFYRNMTKCLHFAE